MSLADKLKNQFTKPDDQKGDPQLVRKQQLAERASVAKADFANNQKALNAIAFLKQKGIGDEKAGFQALMQYHAKLQESSRGSQAKLKEMYETYKDQLKTEGIENFDQFIENERH